MKGQSRNIFLKIKIVAKTFVPLTRWQPKKNEYVTTQNHILQITLLLIKAQWSPIMCRTASKKTKKKKDDKTGVRCWKCQATENQLNKGKDLCPPRQKQLTKPTCICSCQFVKVGQVIHAQIHQEVLLFYSLLHCFVWIHICNSSGSCTLPHGGDIEIVKKSARFKTKNYAEIILLWWIKVHKDINNI